VVTQRCYGRILPWNVRFPTPQAARGSPGVPAGACRRHPTTDDPPGDDDPRVERSGVKGDDITGLRVNHVHVSIRRVERHLSVVLRSNRDP